MNFKGIFLIISMVFISLLVIGAASASEAVGDVIEMSEMGEVQTIETDLIHDEELLANDYDCDDEALSVEELEIGFEHFDFIPSFFTILP